MTWTLGEGWGMEGIQNPQALCRVQKLKIPVPRLSVAQWSTAEVS